MSRELLSLSELFVNKIFRIPDYQRGYAWGDDQLDDFWEDLTNLTDNRYHYTGMLSLKELKRSETKDWIEEGWLLNQGYTAYHVVDGQQRLTTFVILVNSIIDFAKANGIKYIMGKTIEEIESRYIIEYKKPEKILKAYKFGYTVDNPSFEYLRYKIFGENSGGTLTETFYTRNLENAKNFFDKKLKESVGVEIDKSSAIDDLFSKLVNRLQFNLHTIDDDFDVFVAFETMNNRGKQLSNLEILKNRLIYLTTLFKDSNLSPDEKEKLRRDINSAWKEVYFQLGRNKNKSLNDDEYLKSHWTMFFKYSRNKGNDYVKFLLDQHFTPKAVFGLKRTVIMDEVENTDEDNEDQVADVQKIETSDTLQPADIVKYIESLKEVAQYWFYSYNPYFADGSNPLTDEEKKWIDKLNRIGINYFRTLVVASFVNKNITTSERINLFKSIEKFIFLVFRMARYQASFRSNVVYGYARQLMMGEITIQFVIDYINNEFNNNLEYAVKVFKSKMESLCKNGNGYYEWYDLKYFLFEYEYSLSEQTHVTKLDDWSKFTKNDKDKISIEHIFPQTPSCWYWRNQFRDYSKEEKKYLANSLGNLLPLSQSVNSSLQNDEFELKKNANGKRTRGYSNGSNAEIEVSRYSDWNPQTIKERGLKLLQFMENRWQVDLGDKQSKMDLLGISFVDDGRVVSAEIEKESYSDRDGGRKDEEGSMSLEDHLKDKDTDMVDLYNNLYFELKNSIDGLFEKANIAYVGLFDKHEDGIAYVFIQKSQIKIYIKEPTEVEHQIGKIDDKVNYSKNYLILLKKNEDVENVAKAIVSSYMQQ